MDTKLCRKCKTKKPLDQFDRDPRNTGLRGKGVASGCKECRRAQEAAWRAAHPEHSRSYNQSYYQANKAEKRDKDLRRKYGISAVQYDALLAAQGGHCAICPATEPGGRGKLFHVDHDHRTGRVRGLLCHACNTMVTEHFEKYVARAVSYLTAAGLKNVLLDCFELPVVDEVRRVVEGEVGVLEEADGRLAHQVQGGP